jgi:N-acyl homoserine lactone hydrolase
MRPGPWVLISFGPMRTLRTLPTQFLLGAAFAVLASLPLAAPLMAAKPIVSSVRLYVIDCGRLKVEDPSRFDFKKEEIKTLDFSVGCYLVAHPKGVMVWDVGVVPDSTFKGDGPGVKFYGSAAKTMKSQMAAAGYTAADVNYLALSHYHWDHMGNAADFAKSTWLVERIEHDTLFGPTPPERLTPDQYVPLAKSKTIFVKPSTDYDVFGDGTVVIKPAYGHTPGHMVLAVKLAKFGPVVLSGDLYHYPEEVTTGKVPHIDYNKDRTRDARKAVDDYIKTTGAKLWIQHDLDHFATLKKAPEFYE